MVEIRHLENQHDVIFCWGWYYVDKISQTGAEWHMSTAVIWPKSKAEVEFQYGRRLGKFNGISSQNHVSRCRVLPLGEFTVMIPCHIAGCKNSIRHIENSLSQYFILFGFFNAVLALTSGGFRIVSDTLVSQTLLRYVWFIWHEPFVCRLAVYL